MWKTACKAEAVTVSCSHRAGYFPSPALKGTFPQPLRGAPGTGELLRLSRRETPQKTPQKMQALPPASGAELRPGSALPATLPEYFIFISLSSFAVAVVNLPFSKFNKKLIGKGKKRSFQP